MTGGLRPICVIGAGTMGRGIAQVALAAGHEVVLVDPAAAQLAAAAADITSRLLRKRPDAEELVATRLRTATSITDAPQHDDVVVVEAVVEDLAVKHAVFQGAAAHFGASAILATNTSSLSVTAIAAGVERPERVVGMHFFNPVPAMRLVEVVSGLQTSADVATLITDLATSWGKDVVQVRSAPGFIVNRVARPFYGEALKLLEENAAAAETIDEVLRACGQFRMGPFELVDLIGCEVNLTVTETVWEAYNYDPRFAPSRIQRELVAAGRLGRKSGHGFYPYEADRPTARPHTTDRPCPGSVVLHGTCPQLETLLKRAGVEPSSRVPSDTPHLELPGFGHIAVTRGRTAEEESAASGAPMLLLDRCLDPDAAVGLAFSSTDDRLTDEAIALLQPAGVSGYAVDDTPGLVTARIVAMLVNEACETVLHGVASPQDIDTAMRLGTNYPVGPFEWMQRWSPDYVLGVLDALWSEYHDPRYRASRRLRSLARRS
jgi:3-hydroxybutyryl-CoA dehydrogenase